MGAIQIDGKTFKGDAFEIKESKLYVDGVVQPDVLPATVTLALVAGQGVQSINYDSSVKVKRAWRNE